ncbi:MAG TPA: ABC transporter ATP-binding protein [Acidimicrobiales bacterium]|nr:ABC transporter ATP-binding protein [Acidimicrobiales bacterium]
MSAVVTVEDLRVGFTTDEGPVLAVGGVSLSLARGEVLALVGESGCGKSMTALSIMGLLPPTATMSGSITLNGTELTGLSQRRLRGVRGREVAMVFQEPMTSLNPAFTIGFQVGEVLRRHEHLTRRQARERVVELLRQVRIPSPETRVREYPHQLSGGMRQRVMIAMAVACNPAVLIADEPTTALDVTIQAQVLDILRDLRRTLGTAILLITHDLGVVADIADRVEVMYAGHLVESASVEDLFARPQHPYTLGLLGALPRLAGGDRRLREIPGLVPTLRRSPTSCVFAPRCPRAGDRCGELVPDLAEAAPGHVVSCFHPGPGADLPGEPVVGA